MAKMGEGCWVDYSGWVFFNVAELPVRAGSDREHSRRFENTVLNTKLHLGCLI